MIRNLKEGIVMTAEEKLAFLKELTPAGAELLFAEYAGEGVVVADDGTNFTELPPLYRLRVALYPEKNSNIRLELWLPEDWNGRYLATGSGGIGGFIGMGALASNVKNGYAVANCDIGTSAGYSCGYENEAVKTDYGWRATHLMALHGKEITGAFYGKAPAYSYFRGASTGGMQAYSEAQRYPDDFDGIYAEVPSILNVAFHTNYMWAWRHLHGENGPLFTPEERARIAELAACFFRGLGDGEEGDPFVSYPYRDETTIPSFMAYLREHVSAFTEAQFAALQAVYEGPFDEKRHLRLSCGMPIGSERSWGSYCGENCPGTYPFAWCFGGDFNPRAFDFSDDFALFNKRMSKYINAVSPDLTAFLSRGGKLLAMAGTADPVVLYPELNIYYEKAAAACGGVKKLMEGFRYYLLPGRNHGFGYGADSISPVGANAHGAFSVLVKWVEEGIAPYRLDAVSHEDAKYPVKVPFARPIYPYGSTEFPFMPHPESYSDGIVPEN